MFTRYPQQHYHGQPQLRMNNDFWTWRDGRELPMPRRRSQPNLRSYDGDEEDSSSNGSNSRRWNSRSRSRPRESEQERTAGNSRGEVSRGRSSRQTEDNNYFQARQQRLPLQQQRQHLHQQRPYQNQLVQLVPQDDQPLPVVRIIIISIKSKGAVELLP